MALLKAMDTMDKQHDACSFCPLRLVSAFSRRRRTYENGKMLGTTSWCVRDVCVCGVSFTVAL